MATDNRQSQITEPELSLDQALELLRKSGWTCIAPDRPKDVIPDPIEGQVWHSPKPQIEPRTIVRVGSHRAYPWAGPHCVGYTSRSKPPHPEWGPHTMSPGAWRSWARKSGARP